MVVRVGALAVHAEEFRPGGEVLRGDSPEVAARGAQVFARLMAELTNVIVAPPLPNPPWVRWDHTDPGLWPAIEGVKSLDQGAQPANLADTAARSRRRLLAADLPCVLGHADFEAQNLRWHGREIWAVHHSDSLAWQPEAALAGAASGAFASDGPPDQAPIESSEAFLAAYQEVRSRWFTAVEQQVALQPACGWRRTTYGRHCMATPRCPMLRSAHRQPNGSAGLMPNGVDRTSSTPRGAIV
jgi:hypothetical protein